MKIICTETEKKQMIASLMSAESCPLFLIAKSKCDFDPLRETCIDCLNRNLVWEVINDEGS